MAARDELRRVAVDALYAARDSGKMMDAAAEAVMDAVLGRPADVLLALVGDDDGPSLLSDRPLYEYEPDGKRCQTWEVIV